MLGLGVPRALMVLGAVSAAHHAGAIFLANCAPRRGKRRTLRRISMKHQKKCHGAQ
jgi:hypothetical protein